MNETNPLIKKYLFRILEIYKETSPKPLKKPAVFEKMGISPEANDFAKFAMDIFQSAYAKVIDRTDGATINDAGIELFEIFNKERDNKNKTSLRVKVLCVLAIITAIAAVSNLYMSCTKNNKPAQALTTQ